MLLLCTPNPTWIPSLLTQPPALPPFPCSTTSRQISPPIFTTALPMKAALLSSGHLCFPEAGWRAPLLPAPATLLLHRHSGLPSPYSQPNPKSAFCKEWLTYTQTQRTSSTAHCKEDSHGARSRVTAQSIFPVLCLSKAITSVTDIWFALVLLTRPPEVIPQLLLPVFHTNFSSHQGLRHSQSRQVWTSSTWEQNSGTAELHSPDTHCCFMSPE